MTALLVIDASVALKWIVDEPGSAQANAVLDSGVPLAAPEHLIGEVASGLRKRVGRREIDHDDALAALGFVRALPMEFVTGADRWARTLADALRWRITTYDALYVALAVDLDAVLVTADTRLLTSAQVAGLPVRGLQDGPAVPNTCPPT